MDKPQIIAHVQKSVNFTCFDCCWLPRTAKFAVVGQHARGTSALQMYEVVNRDVKVLLDRETPGGIKCCSFGASAAPAQSHLAVGGLDGSLSVWDLSRGDSNAVFSVKSAHPGVVNTLDAVGGVVGEGAPEICTGGRDGAVRVWDPRQPDRPVAEMAPSEGSTGRDCWTVAFGHAYNEHERMVAAGYDNGDIKLFDLRVMKQRWEKNVNNGVCGLQFDRRDIQMNKLVATCLEGRVLVFDMRTQHEEHGFASLTEKSHSSTVWLARHLPQNRDVFATCGGNGSIALWKYEYPDKRVTEPDAKGRVAGVIGSLNQLQSTPLSTQPVAGFDWSPDKLGLAVCTSFDQAFRVLIVTKLNKL